MIAFQFFYPIRIQHTSLQTKFHPKPSKLTCKLVLLRNEKFLVISGICCKLEGLLERGAYL